MLFRCLPAAEFPSVMKELSATLHADALVHVENLIDGIGSKKPELDLFALEAELRGLADEKGRRLGLCVLLEISKSSEGWSDKSKKLLEEYGADPSVMVQEAAVWIFPSE